MKHEEPIQQGNTPEDIFNIKCAEYLKYETMFMGFGTLEKLYYAPTRDGWDNPEEYNPWSNMEQLIEVMEAVVEGEDLHEGDYIGMISEMKEDGVANHMRSILTDILIIDSDIREQQDVAQFFNCNARQFHEEGNYLIFDNREGKTSLEGVGDPSSLYWQAANILVRANYHGFSNFYYTGFRQYVLGWDGDGNDHTEELSMFLDSSYGLSQLLTIENYIRSCDNNFNGLYEGMLERYPYAEWTADEELTTLETIHQHRKYIVRRCLDTLAEPYESEEKQFNRLCERIRLAGEYPGCGIDLSTHRPYSDILQLSKIVEKIVELSEIPFVYNDSDDHIMDAMRDYVLEFSKEQYVDLSPLEN